MRRAVTAVLVSLTIALTAVAIPAAADHNSSPPGQTVCRQHTPNCGKKIQDTTIGPGETKTYADDTWTVEGTITVEGGGTLVVDHAKFKFKDSSDGIVLEEGGTARIVESEFEPASGATELNYKVDAAAGAHLTVNNSRITKGQGVVTRASDTEFSGNTLQEIPVALRLVSITVDIHHNRFEANTVAINNSFGASTIANNSFAGGDFCIRDWRTNPTVVDNHFTGCHTGIFHEESESALSRNVMEDDGDPSGAGMWIKDTMSPVIEGNTITNYGDGVRIVNARAYVRNNSIHHNVDCGVDVTSNSAPMDIQGNEIFNNSRGICLEDVSDVAVFGNEVHSNGIGVHVDGASNLELSVNNVRDNTLEGAKVSAAEADIDSNFFTGNGAYGLGLTAESTGAHVHGNVFADNGDAGLYVNGADGIRVVGNDANGNAASGFAIIGDALDATFRDNAASANGHHGFYLDRVDGLDFTSGDASGNTFDGLQLHNSHGVLVGPSNASGNGAHGFLVADSTNLTVNGGSGYANGEAGWHFESVHNLTMSDSTARLNLVGFQFVGAPGTNLLSGTNASANDLDGYRFANNLTGGIATTTLDDAAALDNGRDGLRVEAGNVTQADFAWWEGNGEAGVNVTDSGAFVSSECSYWGSETGPTHEANPGGTGDAVLGNVDYTPFRTSPTAGCSIGEFYLAYGD